MRHRSAVANGTAPAKGKRKRTEVGSGKPFISASAAGFAYALELVDADVRYNVRSAKYEICFHFLLEPDNWQEANPRRLAHLFELMAERCVFPQHRDSEKPARFTQALRNQVIDAYGYSHEVDPFKNWLAAYLPGTA